MDDIKKIYKELISIEDYKPSKKVNKLFSKIVDFVINGKGDIGLSVKKIKNMRRICGLAEYELEKYWAYKIIRSKLPNKTIKDFPYFKNYELLTDLEWQTLISCDIHKNHTIVFIGSGPLPLTAIMLVEKYYQKLVVVDSSKEACDISSKLIKKLGLQNKISVVCQDGAKYNNYSSFNTIFVAALAGVDENTKCRIFSKIKKCAPEDVHILARSSWGKRKMLYPPVPLNSYKIFRLVTELRPIDTIINSMVIFTNS